VGGGKGRGALKNDDSNNCKGKLGRGEYRNRPRVLRL